MILAYEDMIAIAVGLDRRPAPSPEPSARSEREASGDSDRPGDDFNARATWRDVLEPWGWTWVYERGGLAYWRRPGKDAPGISASAGPRSDCGKDLLHVFSTSTPFDIERSYDKFGAYVVLNHDGDHGAAAKALLAKGYGTPTQAAGKLLLNGKHKEPRKNADNSDDPLDQDATAFDLVCSNNTIRWAWEKWLPPGVLTILASEPGVGKTRFCCDLARRVALGLPWPDGSPQTFPEGSRTLWVAADNQHAELGTLPAAFGFSPQLLYLNATRRNPFAGTMLDDDEDLLDFESRIKRVQPALVFVDTSLNATDRSSHKPEDAKAFFVPLQQIAARQGVVLICVTHLNAAGNPLGRRVMGQGRVVIKLENPDPEGQPNRRKLWVVKSNSLFPPPLGVTMGDTSNDYDTDPPVAPEEGPRPRGRRPHLDADCAWLSERLATGPKRVSHLRQEAEEAGITGPRLYKAKDALGADEFEAENRKWWQLMAMEE